MESASVVKDAIPVRHLTGTADGEPYDYLEADGITYENFKRFPRVLEFQGVIYSWTGWNSGRNVAYFKRNEQVAFVRKSGR